MKDRSPKGDSSREVFDSVYVDTDELRASLTNPHKDLLDYQILNGLGSSSSDRKREVPSSHSSKRPFVASLDQKKSHEIRFNNKNNNTAILQIINNIEIFWGHHQYERNLILKDRQRISDEQEDSLNTKFMDKIYKLFRLKSERRNELSQLLHNINIEKFYDYTIEWMNGYLKSEKIGTVDSFKNDYLNSLKVFVKSQQEISELSAYSSEVKSNVPSVPKAPINVKLENREKNNEVISEITKNLAVLNENWKILLRDRESISNQLDEEAKRNRSEYKHRYRYDLLRKYSASGADRAFKELILCQFGTPGLDIDSLREIQDADAHELLKAVNTFIDKYLRLQTIDLADFRARYAEMIRAFPNNNMNEEFTEQQPEMKFSELSGLTSSHQKSQLPNAGVSMRSRKNHPTEHKEDIEAKKSFLELFVLGLKSIASGFKNIFSCFFRRDDDGVRVLTKTRPEMTSPKTEARSQPSTFKRLLGCFRCCSGGSVGLYPPATVDRTQLQSSPTRVLSSPSSSPGKVNGIFQLNSKTSNQSKVLDFKQQGISYQPKG